MTVKAATISAARDALAGQRALCAGATDAERLPLLKNLAEFVGKPDVLRVGTQGERTQFWATYHRTLSNVPYAVLQRACDAFLNQPGQKFMPDPGALLALARKDYGWCDDLDVLKGLQRLSVAKPDGPREYASDEEWAEISKRVAAIGKRARELDARDEAESRAGVDAILESMRSRGTLRPADPEAEDIAA